MDPTVRLLFALAMRCRVQPEFSGSRLDQRTRKMEFTWFQELGAGQRHGSAYYFLTTLRGWCASAALKDLAANT